MTCACRDVDCNCLSFPNGEHKWVDHDEGYICEDCGTYAEVTIVDMACYGDSPVELDGWLYSWLGNNTEPPDCESVIMEKALK